MSGNQYLLVAYVIGLGLPWGYAVFLWLNSRSLERRERGRT
jgi:hypothetical protein